MNWIEPLEIDSQVAFAGLHPLVARSLSRRGIITEKAVRAFLDPQSYTPSPADQLPGLTNIAERLDRAIQQRESICVWGDFDADGQTSTTILVQTLQELGALVTYHIPVRERESHGVNIPHLKEIIEQGARLILTCDTGISAHAAVDFANSQGATMLITDHHDLPETLPNALAITNPKLLPKEHALATLSGSGLAYKLAEQLYQDFGRHGDVLGLQDLAAIGLVADLAELTGDARYLVQCGLENLRHTERLGLKTIMEMAELTPSALTEEHIGFVLAPRLNALGRLEDANSAVEFLTTTDPMRARLLATRLEGLNIQRQLLCNQVTRAAEAQLKADPAMLEQPILILGHPAWPGGVVGIVASRLVERYNKPAILFSTPEGAAAHGSARSVEGLNITAAIAAQKDLLINFGGHPMAAGVSLEAQDLPEFRRRMAKTVTDLLPPLKRESQLALDAWIGLPEITAELADAIESLAPFGPGNEKLILATHALSLHSATTIGRNKEHLVLNVADAIGNSQKVLWWNGADEKDDLPRGRFDLAYSLRSVDWRGASQIQLEFVDLRNLGPVSVAVKTLSIDTIDHRDTNEPEKILDSLQQNDQILVWAEGEAAKIPDGHTRYGLMPSDTLVIWTTPASLEILQIALEQVHPKTIHLFAVTGFEDTAESFTSRLAGLLKFAINRREGKVAWSDLETATAQRSLCVRSAVEWLAALGQLEIGEQENGILCVKVGSGQKDPNRSAQLWSEIQALLAETVAYRFYFKHASKDMLFSLY